MGLAAVTIGRNYLRLLGPLEELPSEAVFIVRRVDGRIVIIIAAPALTGHPTETYAISPLMKLPFLAVG
jgi:hypothetical protein